MEQKVPGSEETGKENYPTARLGYRNNRVVELISPRRNRTVLHEPIFREYTCTLSEKNCARLLRALAISGGSIATSSPLHPRSSELNIGRQKMLYRLRFGSPQSLDKFHSLWMETPEPEHQSKII